MSRREVRPSLDAVQSVAERSAGLELLMLYGSRSRDDAHTDSDWDFGYLGATVDTAGLVAGIVEALGTDRIDLVDLDRASGLLRFRAARDGVMVFAGAERDARFRLEAIRFWCDAAPVLERGYQAVLQNLAS